MEKSKRKTRLKINREERKIKIKFKIIRIYYSKLKDNDTRQKIRMKTHNLTQICARIDPIDHRIKGFLFCDFEEENRHSRGNFSLFFR